MTLLLTSNGGRTNEQDRESSELIGGSERKLHARVRNSVDNRSTEFAYAINKLMMEEIGTTIPESFKVFVCVTTPDEPSFPTCYSRISSNPKFIKISLASLLSQP